MGFKAKVTVKIANFRTFSGHFWAIFFEETMVTVDFYFVYFQIVLDICLTRTNKSKDLANMTLYFLTSINFY